MSTVVNKTTQSCQCEPGWFGDRCDQCINRFCKHGRCFNDPSECICFSSYSGKNCDRRELACDSFDPCRYERMHTICESVNSTHYQCCRQELPFCTMVKQKQPELYYKMRRENTDDIVTGFEFFTIITIAQFVIVLSLSYGQHDILNLIKMFCFSLLQDSRQKSYLQVP